MLFMFSVLFTKEITSSPNYMLSMCRKMIARRSLGTYLATNLGLPFLLGYNDAEDVQDFSAKLDSLKEKWDHIHPDFYDWFCKHESSIFRDSLIACVRSCAGLGQPSTKYITNNESINKMVKEHVRFRMARVSS